MGIDPPTLTDFKRSEVRAKTRQPIFRLDHAPLYLCCSSFSQSPAHTMGTHFVIATQIDGNPDITI